jgi:single-stranded DNA-binding protein
MSKALGTIAGRLAANPRPVNTANGNSCCVITVAVNESWTRDGERQERTDFLDVMAFDSKADYLLRYARKGQGITMIDVKLRTSTEAVQDTTGKTYNRKVVRLQTTPNTHIANLSDPRGGPGSMGDDEASAEANLPLEDDVNADIPF